MTRKFLVLALTLMIVPLALVACGDDSSDTTSAADTSASTTEASSGGSGGSVAVSETEYKLDPSDPTTGAGTVSFEVTNDGQIPHNLEIEGNGVEEVTDTIDPGSSATLDVDLQPGTYEIYCSIADHADQGMTGELTVQ